MLCLQVYCGHYIAGHLRDTKVDGQLRGLYSPTVKGQRPGWHDANCVGYRGRYHGARQALNTSRLLQNFRAQQDRAGTRPLQCECSCPTQSSLVCCSISSQTKQGGIRGLAAEIEHQRKVPDLRHRLRGYEVEILVGGFLV